MAARTQRLTLAAEMQWELLPGRSRIRPSFSLAGQLEPAYAVRGDSFDWADDERPAVADDAQRHRRGRGRGVC